MYTQRELDVAVDESLLRLTAQWAKSNTPAEHGDDVCIDYYAECNEMPVPELSTNNRRFTLGDPSVLEQFNQIIGKKQGEQLTIAITFPQGFSVQRIEGQEVLFRVTLQEINHRHPIVPTDSIACAIDPQVSNLQELKDKLREAISGRWLHMIEEARTSAILNAIRKGAVVEFDPDEFQKVYLTILQAKQQELATSSVPQTLDSLLTVDNSSLSNECRRLAEKAIEEKLIIAQISQLEDISISPEELNENREALKSITQDSEALARLLTQEEAFYQYLLKEKVLDYLWECNPL